MSGEPEASEQKRVKKDKRILSPTCTIRNCGLGVVRGLGEGHDHDVAMVRMRLVAREERP